MITEELRELIKEKNPRIARKLTNEQIDSVIEESEKVTFRKTTKIVVEFKTETESDILAYVLEQCNKSGYIKELIRKDMIKKNMERADEEEEE